MPVQETVGSSRVTVLTGDITDLPVDGIVYHARPDQILGSGPGTAISVRGGPSIQAELRQVGGAPVGEAVVTGAGNLKAKFIIHTVGPRFQEEETEAKLRAAITSALKRASERGIRRVAFPAVGSGFYGVPIEMGARIVVSTVVEYLREHAEIEELTFCLVDSRECRAYEAQLRTFCGQPAAAHS